MMLIRNLSRAAALLRRDRRGNVAVSCAILLPIAGVLAAVAVDEGAIFAERRNLQGLTDLAAIAAASTPARASDAALALFRENGLDAVRAAQDAPSGSPAMASGGSTARIEAGRYDRRSTVRVENRFVAGAQPSNAFRVTLTRNPTQYFSSGLVRLPPMQTVATAHASAEAAFSVGSRLAGVHDGIANAVLGALLGAKISLSAMDYRALAEARIDIPALLGATAGSLNLEAATFADLLRADLPLASLLRQAAASPGLDKAAESALRLLAAGAPKEQKVRLGDLFSLGPDLERRTVRQGTGGFSAFATAADIAGAAVAIAGRGRQVEVSLGAGLPGIAGVTLHLAVGEPMQASPWVGTGEPGATVRTAQTRLFAVFSLGGPGGILGTTLRLPVYAEAAQAEATLAAIRCETGRLQPSGVTVDAVPGLAELRIGDVDRRALSDFRTAPALGPGAIVGTPLASVSGSGRVVLSDGAATRLTFSAEEIAAGATKQARSRGFVASPLASLLGSLRLDVDVLGAGAGLPAPLGASVSRSLLGHAGAVDLVLASALDALGVSLGEADVTVNGAACRRAVLVQ